MPLVRSVGPYFDHSGNFTRRVERWTGPTSYPTGGEACAPADFGMGNLVKGIEGIASDGASLRFVWWNPTTNKLLWFSDGTTQVVNGTNLSAFSVQFEVVGI
jgi:hypothetical protein